MSIISIRSDKRKSLGLLSKDLLTTPALNDRQEPFVNDDESERRLGREQRRRILPDAETPASSVSSRLSVGKEKLSKMTSIERHSHMEKCMQLSAENKISSKNAFSLHLIDMTLERIKKDDSNFQVASTHLDASTKIYACRVDKVHMEAMRIAGGLIDSEKKGSKKKIVDDDDDDGMNDGGNDNDPNASGDELETAASKTKKTRKSRQKDIIVKKENLAQINSTSHLNVQNNNEGFLHEVITSAEASEPGNCYFISNFEVMDNSCELMLLAEIPSYRRKCAEDLSAAGLICDMPLPKLTLPNVADLPICPELKSLLDPERDSSKPEDEDGDDAMDYQAYGDTEPAADDNEDDYDMGGVNDDNTDDMDGVDDTVGTVAPPETHRGPQQSTDHIVDFTSSISAMLLGPLQYSMYHRKSFNLMAGPASWKVGPSSAARPSSIMKKVSIKRKAKKPVELLYEEDESIFLPISCRTKVELMAKTIELYATKVLVTHPMEDFSLSCFEKLEVNDCIQVLGASCKNKADEEKGSPQTTSINFAEDDDCGGGDDMGNDDMDHGDDGLPTVGMSYSSLMEDDAHEVMTNKEGDAIPFAMRAKKIDMKLLKATIWNSLKDAESNKENAVCNMPTPILFSKLYRDLPPKLSPKMVAALTPHLAFMALLHLANEQNLCVKEQGDLSDVKVTFEMFE